MTRLLIVGFGDVGTRLAKQVLRQKAYAKTGGARVAALTRSQDSFDAAKAFSIRVFQGDLAKRTSLIRACAWAQAIVHLAPPPNEGKTDPHTKHLIAAIGAASTARPLQFCYISTTGVYGDHQGAIVRETSRQHTGTARAVRRVDAEAQLRKAAARGLLRLSILRAPGIYAQERLPLERLRAGTPALTPSDDMFTNHVHADDLAKMAMAALRLAGNSRLFNAVDCSQLKMGDYFDLVADACHLPRPPRVARTDIAQHVSPAMLSFMHESRRMAPDRVVKELRFRHAYPTVADTLQRIR